MYTDLLSPADIESVEKAIAEAEEKTAGEIRILVVNSSNSPAMIKLYKGLMVVLYLLEGYFKKSLLEGVEKRAIEEFQHLNMEETRDRTGVLVMLSYLEHQVVVVADKSINEKVEEGTWSTTIDLILKGITENQPAQGLTAAVAQIGDLLAENFPIKPDDTNELSNKIEFKE